MMFVLNDKYFILQTIVEQRWWREAFFLFGEDREAIVSLTRVPIVKMSCLTRGQGVWSPFPFLISWIFMPFSKMAPFSFKFLSEFQKALLVFWVTALGSLGCTWAIGSLKKPCWLWGRPWLKENRLPSAGCPAALLPPLIHLTSHFLESTLQQSYKVSWGLGRLAWWQSAGSACHGPGSESQCTE